MASVNPKLSRDFELYFKNNYATMIGTGGVGMVARYIHSKMEKLWAKTGSPPEGISILEVGSGQSQHREFVQNTYEKYTELDRFSNGNIPTEDKRIVFTLGDCQNLEGFEAQSFDRVIATCLLVHLPEPEKALNEWRRVTKNAGVISLWIALEPSILLRVIQRLSTKRKVEKLGFDYYSMHYRDHINHYPRMRQLLKEVFAVDQIKIHKFPFKGLIWDFNLVEIWTIKIIKSEENGETKFKS
jgi:phosphatidylethanolamine/phosphatidyl-N-methylethanolamine N-methyltransferase